MNQLTKILTLDAKKLKYERALKRGSSTAVLVLFAQGLSGCFRQADEGGSSISGVAFDGPLSRAKVFVDANNNNLLDGSEDWAWTNADGTFALTTNATGPLVVVGTSETTDASSGASVDGLVLTAPTGSSVISPATTVAKKIADDAIDALGVGATEEQIAEAINDAYGQAAKAFGLSEAFTGADATESLSTFNPFSGDTTSEDAVAYAQAAAKIVAVANTIATAEAASADGADKGTVILSALETIADQALLAVDEGNELVVDADFVKTVIDNTTAVTEVAANEDLKNALGDAVATISTAIDDNVTDTTADTAGDVLFTAQSILAETAQSAAKSFVLGEDDITGLTFLKTADIATLAGTYIRVSGDTIGELSEDNNLLGAESHTLTGTLTITDPDATDEITYQFDTDPENIDFLGAGDPKGTLSLTAEGQWTYTVTASTMADLNTLQAPVNKGAVNANEGANFTDVNFQIVEAFKVYITDAEGASVYIDSDNTIKASKIVTVKITGENDAPTLVGDFQTPADVAIAQGLEISDSSVINFGGAFEDVDTADVLIFSAEGLPDGVTINENTGVISGEPSSSAFGEHSIIVSATDAVGASVSSLAFKITVTNTNDSPETVSQGAVTVTATEDAALAYDAAALFTDPDIANGHDATDILTYSLASPVEWLSIDEATGAITGTPDNGDVTSEAFTIVVTATDAYSLSVTQEISVSVENTNDAPIATSLDLGILRDTASKTLTIDNFTDAVTDVDVGDTKILNSVSIQQGAGSIVNNGDNTFTFTPVDGDENATVTLSYTVSDSAGVTSSSTAELLVVDAIPVGTGNEDGGPITLSAEGYGSATFAVAASETDLASKGSFENGVFTPNPNWFGSVAFDITTSAGELPGVLVVSSVNDAPIIDADNTDAALVVLDDGGTVTGTITATDLETSDLTYTASTPSKGTVTFTEGGAYSYTADPGEEGSDSFTITVSDGTTSDDKTQVVSVQIGAVSVGSGTEDSGAISIAAVGYEGATVTLAANENLNGKGTLSEDGTSFTPEANWFGTINFQVETADGETLPGALVVTSVNDAPVIGTSDTTISVDEDSSVTGTINATDIETTELTYSASVPTIGSVVFGDGGQFTYTPEANKNGADSFTVTVSDGTDTDTVTVNVTVNAVDDAPTLSSQPYQWISEKLSYSDAQANAVALGGNLAAINSEAEMSGLYQLASSRYEQDSSTNLWGTASDGGGISYIWLGASDADSEGTWVWETGEAFDYTNWGTAEPDNYNNQDGLGLGLSIWPDGSSTEDAYGLAGQWNDIDVSNEHTSIVEYDDGTSAVSIKEGSASATSIVYVGVASDIDSGPIVYSLTGTDADSFNVSSGGAVTLKEAADYETKTSYSFDYVATADGKSATQSVTLNVIDVDEPAVLSAESSSSGNDHTVVLSVDATAISDADFVSINGFDLAFSGTGAPSSSSGISKTGLNYARFDDSSTNRDAIANDWGVSVYTTTGSFRSDIFGTDETWGLAGGDAVALATEDPVYQVVVGGDTYDITSYIGTTFEIGTLTFTTASDVTDLNITITGSVTGNDADGGSSLTEALVPITVDVI